MKDNIKTVNYFESLGEDFFSYCQATPIREPHLVHKNNHLIEKLNLSDLFLKNGKCNKIFTGEIPFSDSCKSFSMVYSGHQFGSYVKRLGDGRVHNIAQIEQGGNIYDIQLKGSGRTPYSRFGDGRAVLRSSIREYLASYAMKSLAIPTTEALCLYAGEDTVEREVMEKSAIVTRVAPSFVRFGNFEYFTHSKQPQNTVKLADYIISRFFPEISSPYNLELSQGKISNYKRSSKLNDYKEDLHSKYARFLFVVVERTARLMAKWQAVGFAHGVMNTDNMSILGLTIDYGPYGFLDGFEAGFIPNDSDYSGRYNFSNQPNIAMWNLQALAYAFEPLMPLAEAMDIISLYKTIFFEEFLHEMRLKLGLNESNKSDVKLIEDLFHTLNVEKNDYSIFFRQLCDFKFSQNEINAQECNENLFSLFNNSNRIVKWLKSYRERILQEGWGEFNKDSERFFRARAKSMRAANPKYILRNYMMQTAIKMAEEGDYSEVATLIQLLEKPFDEQPNLEKYAALPPLWAKDICISCSS